MTKDDHRVLEIVISLARLARAALTVQEVNEFLGRIPNKVEGLTKGEKLADSLLPFLDAARNFWE